jgi:hypothetical protein
VPVRAVGANKVGHDYRPVRGVTDGEGRFEIWGLKDGTYDVYAGGGDSGWGCGVATLRGAGRPGTEVRLVAEATLSGFVALADGSPRRDGRIIATPTDGATPEESIWIGADATFRVPGLRPGRYRLRLDEARASRPLGEFDAPAEGLVLRVRRRSRRSAERSGRESMPRATGSRRAAGERTRPAPVAGPTRRPPTPPRDPACSSRRGSS